MRRCCSARLLISRGDALIDVLLQLAFRQACFGEREPRGGGGRAPGQLPRTRAAFESAVDRARGQLHASVAEFSAMLAGWCAEARAVPAAR